MSEAGRHQRRPPVRAHAPVPLGRWLRRAAAQDPYRAGLQVDVIPGQPEQLALAAPGADSECRGAGAARSPAGNLCCYLLSGPTTNERLEVPAAAPVAVAGSWRAPSGPDRTTRGRP